MILTVSNNKARILKFLQANDDSFSPALSSRINLDTYSEKLATSAVNLFVLSDNSEDVGHAAVYVNNGASSFLSSFCLQKAAHGTGAASCLLKYVYQYCLKHKSLQLELEVAEANTRAIRFYHKHGFSVVKQLSNSSLMRKSLETVG